MKSLLTTLALLGGVSSAFAQLVIPSDGTDGTFSPAANIEVDLSQAVTGTWSDANGANAGKGIYDATKWAIVFKYSSVNIPAGVTVTFKNHPSHAPVIWLVQGGVDIAGTVSVNGKIGASGTEAIYPSEPGPGGFRGAASGPAGLGAGLGIGGGNGYGVYNTTYGNPQILPLIGGSGGQGNFSGVPFAGGGGGGAILIAAPGTIDLTGSLTSLNSNAPNVYGGSGGAVKLIANQVTGTGTLDASSSGRVRIEANALSATVLTNPPTIAVAPGTTPIIFQSANSPTVKIVSVDGVNSPADPTAPLISSADIAIQKNTPVTIVLETRNFATAGAVVSVRIANKFGNPNAASLNATLDSGGTSVLSTWTVSTTLAPGFVTLQARATAP